MDFIFMLTRQDLTVEDCLDVLRAVAPLGLGHVGFKDVGVDRATLRALNRAIRDSGARSYLEVVSPDPEASLDSARMAVELGVDRLLGGTEVDRILDILGGSGIAYYPFPGRPRGHPSVLHGTARDIAADCRAFADRGCAGVDLLAYRAAEAAPLDLLRAARDATRGQVIVAGSVDSAARIKEIASAGADAFTIGSAVFDGTIAPRKGAIESRLRAVLDACAAAAPGAAA